MRADKFKRLALFFFHEGRFSQSKVPQNLALFRNLRWPHELAGRVVVVIPDIQFQGKIRAQRDELVKLHIISDCPRQATENRGASGQRRLLQGKLCRAHSSISRPTQQEG